MHDKAEQIPGQSATPDAQSTHPAPENQGSQSTDNQLILSAVELRVVGALMEKQLSTPDSYPLTVNSLLNACNQKSSRDPVTAYTQGEVVRALRQLEERKLIHYEMGARSERYAQALSQHLSLSRQQQALLCVMMLRGPQSANELMRCTQRLCEFNDSDHLLTSLQRMTQGNEPVAVRLTRQAGQRDERYTHLLNGAPDTTTITAQSPPAAKPAGETADASSDIESLQAEVDSLRQQLQRLYELTGHSIEADDR